MPLAGIEDADPAEIARRIRSWLTDSALPLWASRGYDRVGGGFQERLAFDGVPDRRCPRRLMVQARQIYVYAHAAALGWYPEGKALALQALEVLLARYRSPDGAPGYVFSVMPDGAVADPLRDTYGHTFLLLALGWLARVSGDAQVRALIDDLLAFFDEHLADGAGAYREGVPARLPRRQNPHMHALEGMLALHETIGHGQALARAGRLRMLLEARFVDPATGHLGEYFADDWQPWRNDSPIEPGHHAEWAWLLSRYAALTRTPADPRARALLDIASTYRHPESGLLPDAVVPGGNPGTTYRCWPQTEFAKAWLAQHETGRPGAAGNAAAMLAGVQARYLSQVVPGGWVDQIDDGGGPLSTFMPASTLYHLFVAVAEADRVLLRPFSGSP